MLVKVISLKYAQLNIINILIFHKNIFIFKFTMNYTHFQKKYCSNVRISKNQKALDVGF
jgi:hypothetical protein